MLNFNQKIRYIINSVLRYGSPVVCPSCTNRGNKLIDRKFIFTRLFECGKCNLYFRHPTDSVETNKDFYQKSYSESDGLTTYMPPLEELESLKKIDFSTASNRGASRLKRLFECFFDDLQGVKILDYGASWGYLSYQFRGYGMDVESFEISVPRAKFGNESLFLKIHTKDSELRTGNDIFFSSHVIEHVPSVANMLNFGGSLVRKNGFSITICPNGSPAYRKSNPNAFSKCWGKVHPNYLNAECFRHHYRDSPFFITTSPFDFDTVRGWNKCSQHVDERLAGQELLVISKH